MLDYVTEKLKGISIGETVSIFTAFSIVMACFYYVGFFYQIDTQLVMNLSYKDILLGGGIALISLLIVLGTGFSAGIEAGLEYRRFDNAPKEKKIDILDLITRFMMPPMWLFFIFSAARGTKYDILVFICFILNVTYMMYFMAIYDGDFAPALAIIFNILGIVSVFSNAFMLIGTLFSSKMGISLVIAVHLVVFSFVVGRINFISGLRDVNGEQVIFSDGSRKELNLLATLADIYVFADRRTILLVKKESVNSIVFKLKSLSLTASEDEAANHIPRDERDDINAEKRSNLLWAR